MADTSLTQQDADAREAALDVTRSFIVQAPAGSGKTELLIQRYLRLLATVDEPEEVVAITFTRKAAAEMLERVSAALERARTGNAPAASHERVTYDAAHAVLERDREFGWSLDKARFRMRIQTLDALCGGITRLLPVTSGVGGGAAMLRDDEATALCRAAALATLDWLLETGPERRQVEIVLAHLDNDIQRYQERVASMLATRDQWLGLVGSGGGDLDRVRNTLELAARRAIENALEALAPRFTERMPPGWLDLARYAADCLETTGKQDHPAMALRDIASTPGSDADELARWRGIASLLVTNDGSWRKRLDKNVGFPPAGKSQKQAWLEVIAELSHDTGLARQLAALAELPPPRYSDEQWRVLKALFDVLPLAVSELRRLFGERSASDYTEVALAADDALGTAEAPGDIALLLDYRIRHLLVDEMQDTSLLQYRLLETLTAGWERGDGRSFFCVGDPMQSIYRFRNAEVGQFLRAREEGLGQLPLDALTLMRNFRSGAGLVDWFNTQFSKLLAVADDAFSGAISYSPSTSVPGNGGYGHVRIHAAAELDASDEANWTAGLVGSCVAEEATGTVAILVRSRTQLPALLAALRDLGIDYEAVEIDRLADVPELIDVLALTRAMIHPQDRAAWLALLRGPLAGFSWTDLHALVEDAPRVTVWELINDPLRQAHLSIAAQTTLQPLLRVLRSAFAPESRALSLRARVEAAWLRLGGAAILKTSDEVDNVYRFLDVVEREEVAGTLADPLRLEVALAEERVSSRPTADCRVTVMTMHKAKGLEFDHVVLPFLGRTTRGATSSVMEWLAVPGAEGGTEMLLSPVGASHADDPDPLHRYITTQRRAADRLEVDRLLYVACTRARRSLHLAASLSLDADSGAAKSPKEGTLLRHFWPALESAFSAQVLDNQFVRDTDEESGVFAQPVLRRRAPDWRAPSAEALPVSATVAPHDRAATDPQQVHYEWVGSAARNAGTIVHRWLHRLVIEGVPEELDPDFVASRTRAWSLELGVPAADSDAVVARVQAALQATLNDQRGRWLLSGAGYAELALTGVHDQRLRSMVLDRVRIDEGVHWIVDYKTSSHEGGGVDAFIEQELIRYREQLEGYASLYRAFANPPALRTALYFPLMQRFAELPLAQGG